MDDPGYARLADMLKGLNADVARAKSIILVTAHWETERPTMTVSERPGMLYDYNGFPEETYHLKYPAPGAPKLANKVVDALRSHGFHIELDQNRGFDHGTFVPMMLIRPEADIPILQMSVLSSLDPTQHLKMGKALADVLRDDILLIGSGFSFHNLKALTGRLTEEDAAQGQNLAAAFHDWLDDIVCDPELASAKRDRLLTDWTAAPGARFCQPREEHLLPLHVCVGAAQAGNMTGRKIFGEPVKGYQTSGYQWC